MSEAEDEELRSLLTVCVTFLKDRIKSSAIITSREEFLQGTTREEELQSSQVSKSLNFADHHGDSHLSAKQSAQRGWHPVPTVTDLSPRRVQQHSLPSELHPKRAQSACLAA
ncbi:hypothetical protein BaRGS_00036372 [Batillaria attramentaria]|uniref:Uncharacterized protein n=1 Tax=Batillaria attramentaria TaxID=370345 RepID=A0ABD0JC63_9CAEN